MIDMFPFALFESQRSRQRDRETERQAIKTADNLLHLNEQRRCVYVICASQNVPSDLGSKAAGKSLKAFWVQGRDGGKEVKEGMMQRKKKKSGRGRDRCGEDSPGLANQSEHTWIRRFKSFLFFMHFRAFYISGYIMFRCT